jgi:phosphoglycolate phosphatase-like HAD superfamily hydrolase
MFDFDGTLSLIRAGWMDVMLDMMMEILEPLGPDAGVLRAQAEDYVARLTGKDTVWQMMAFADHVESLGGEIQDPVAMKAEFIRRMEFTRAARLGAVERGRMPPDSLMVPGSRQLLEWLRAEGIRIYLASGTVHSDICHDAAVLGIARYFDGIYGAGPDGMTKKELLGKIVSGGVPGESILTFGDGTVEIEDTKEVGGTAVGVASDEPECVKVDEKKRLWLLRAGADYIIPNYLDEELPQVVLGLR